MKSYSVGIGIRIFLLFLAILFSCFFYVKNNLSFAFIGLFVSIYISVLIFHFSNNQNRKLQKIFESIHYQDFNITFKKDNAYGRSFNDLNEELNKLIKRFSQERSEREATYHFIEAIIKQLSIGILVINGNQKIELSNQVATRLLNKIRLNHLSELDPDYQEFKEFITHAKSTSNKLIKLKDRELSVSVSELLSRGRRLKLVSFQDIKSELQNKELEAWQNLTKVLRHEIMNSLTPIISLTETAEDIVKQDIKTENHEAYQDLLVSMHTIKNRSKGILNFVNAYREFTKLPEPNIEKFYVSELQDPILLLFANQQENIEIELAKDFEMEADKDQLTQVLINIIKNAQEAVENVASPKVKIVFSKSQKTVQIAVIDNGSGIDEDQKEQIFVPFYSTKTNGSGVGLSLSRQIVQNHGGKLSFEKNENGGATFRIEMGA